jgi:hypothetical protein
MQEGIQNSTPLTASISASALHQYGSEELVAFLRSLKSYDDNVI